MTQEETCGQDGSWGVLRALRELCLLGKGSYTPWLQATLPRVWGSVTEPQPGLSGFLTLGQPQAALPVNWTWSLRVNSFACADLDHK